MTDLLLKELDVTDFRSIRGHVHAPLDAQVVLVHGENGAGKTSLLSAIELALTGSVQSLRRADPGYAKQLMHRSASRGSVSIQMVGGAGTFEAALSPEGIVSSRPLDATQAAFLTERSYLPQALLGQLLQIYQDSGSEADSPLARFVGELLRLDRLDAIEAGLKSLGDVRNVRKIVDSWSENELEKARLDALIKDQNGTLLQLIEDIGVEMSKVRSATTTLRLTIEPDERKLDEMHTALSAAEDEQALASLTDRRRHLASIRRELATATATALAAPGIVSTNQTQTVEPGAFDRWEEEHGAEYQALRTCIGTLMSDVSLPADIEAFAKAALKQLVARSQEAGTRRDKAKKDAERLATARQELDVARERLRTIDDEVAGIPTTSGGLASILSELTSFIDDDVCPVCDRNYAEMQHGSLADHVHSKVRSLSGSAQRLLDLGRTRTEAQASIEKLEREIVALEQGVVDARGLAELDRSAAELESTRAALAEMQEILAEGSKLRSTEVASQRAVSEAQSRSVVLTAARQTLSEFAMTIAGSPITDGEDLTAAGERLQVQLDTEMTGVDARIAARRTGSQAIAQIRTLQVRADAISKTISDHDEALKKVKAAAQRAQKVRNQGTSIRDAVDAIRSGIIRREFNDRLNRLWRDLFVRLAHSEPFIPAFRIPDAGTQRIQPRLVTEHRDGGAAGGTPGAMLSAGNLNTAALTLFLSLHLSVPKTLPWLILDDPVQSMDDVHIAHLAALLRTLSKEHERQIIIAVHDRQLFEYLRLEMSPAFPEDSLLTLELSRGTHQDTHCLSRRFSYQEETALLAA